MIQPVVIETIKFNTEELSKLSERYPVPSDLLVSNDGALKQMLGGPSTFHLMSTQNLYFEEEYPKSFPKKQRHKSTDRSSLIIVPDVTPDFKIEGLKP